MTRIRDITKAEDEDSFVKASRTNRKPPKLLDKTTSFKLQSLEEQNKTLSTRNLLLTNLLKRALPYVPPSIREAWDSLSTNGEFDVHP